MNATAADVGRRIEDCQRPLISSHIRLDGDAIGSELGLAFMLRALGKQPHIVNDGALPQMYEFLPDAHTIGTSPAALRDNYDLIVVVDAASWSRLEAIQARLAKGLPSVFIDHHRTDGPNGDLNYIDPESSSAGELVCLVAAARNWPISREAATALYAAIDTDTGRFAFPNVTPRTLRVAGDLLAHGADHRLLMEHVYFAEPLNQLQLRGEVMANLRTHDGGAIAVARVTLAMLRKYRVAAADTQKIADVPRSVAGVKVGIMLREMDEGGIKISLRSGKGVNVQTVAQAFGGGGHHEAAGGQDRGTIDEVEERIVAAVRRAIRATAEKRP